MSAICLCLINDEKLETIAERFDVFESDILLLKESIVRVLMGISAIVSAIDKSQMGEDLAKEQKRDMSSVYSVSTALTNMLHYQITIEYVALTKLDGVGGKTARILASHGYKSLRIIANADPSQLSSIKGIGKKLSEQIVPQAAKLIANGEAGIYSAELLSDSTSRSVAKTSIDPYRLRRSMELSLKGTDGGKYHISGGREDHVVLRQGSSFHCDCLDYEKRHEDCFNHVLTFFN